MTHNTKEQLAKNLKFHLEKNTPLQQFSEVYSYSCLPPGKLFRPHLAAMSFAKLKGIDELSSELLNPNSPISLFCSALEAHHAYTLVHDDLPCMDDDDMRRDRPSTHKQFGQWQAVLGGDGLLNLSYALLTKIKHTQGHLLLTLSSWMLGPRGLILGQVLDLSEQMNESFQKLIWTHQLKTGRLIQLALLGGYLLAEDKAPNKDKLNNLRRFGEALGVLFQLLDDLTELIEVELNEHELRVNPWIQHFEKTLEATLDQGNILLAEIELYKELGLQNYSNKIWSIIHHKQGNVLTHIEAKSEKLQPVMLMLERLSQFQN